MKSFQEILKNICVTREFYDKMNSKISGDTTEKEFVRMIREVYTDFNTCKVCGNDLESHEDGFLTKSHGCCDECDKLTWV